MDINLGVVVAEKDGEGDAKIDLGVGEPQEARLGGLFSASFALPNGEADGLAHSGGSAALALSGFVANDAKPPKGDLS